MTRHPAVLATALASALILAASPLAGQAPGTSIAEAKGFVPGRHALGFELGFLSTPFAREDPYSFATTLGLWYELKLGRARATTLGAWAAASEFRPLESAFVPSRMYTFGLELGRSFALSRSDESLMALRPFARGGWYLREAGITGWTAWSSRPLAAAGLSVELELAGLGAAFSVQLALPLDREPLALAAAAQRYAWRF